MFNCIALLYFEKNVAWRIKVHVYIVEETLFNLKDNTTNTIVNGKMCNVTPSTYPDLYDNIFHLLEAEAIM